MSSLVRIVAPAEEPITLDEARLHLRLDADFTDDDPLVGTLIQAAREYVESDTHRALLPQTWRLTRDAFPCENALSLEASDVASVTSFSYVDATGAPTPFAAYILDADATPARVVRNFGTTWPNARVQRNAVVVEFERQMAADPSGIPAKIKAAMKLLVGHWYENREAVLVDSRAAGITVPLAVDALLAEYRRPAAGIA